MRLVVGADLEVEDVAAILEGDQLRLEERLGERLEGTPPPCPRLGMNSSHAS